MIRCALLAACVAISLALPLAAEAQTHRHFTADTLRGDLQVGVFPDVLINSKPARLAPGARVRGDHNLLITTSELVGKRPMVHYRVHSDGLIQDVWVLNSAELANRVWPSSPQQAAQWRFDAATQTWSKP